MNRLVFVMAVFVITLTFTSCQQITGLSEEGIRSMARQEVVYQLANEDGKLVAALVPTPDGDDTIMFNASGEKALLGFYMNDGNPSLVMYNSSRDIIVSMGTWHSSGDGLLIITASLK